MGFPGVLSYLKRGSKFNIFVLMEAYYSFFNDIQAWQRCLVFVLESQMVTTECKEEENYIWISQNKPITQIGLWIFNLHINSPIDKQGLQNKWINA